MHGRHRGLYLHRDQNNDGWGAVLIFGADLEGFDQRYITYAVKLPCPGWCGVPACIGCIACVVFCARLMGTSCARCRSLVLGDFRRLLHCVASGEGDGEGEGSGHGHLLSLHLAPAPLRCTSPLRHRAALLAGARAAQVRGDWVR